MTSTEVTDPEHVTTVWEEDSPSDASPLIFRRRRRPSDDAEPSCSEGSGARDPDVEIIASSPRPDTGGSGGDERGPSPLRMLEGAPAPPPPRVLEGVPPVVSTLRRSPVYQPTPLSQSWWKAKGFSAKPWDDLAEELRITKDHISTAASIAGLLGSALGSLQPDLADWHDKILSYGRLESSAAKLKTRVGQLEEALGSHTREIEALREAHREETAGLREAHREETEGLREALEGERSSVRELTERLAVSEVRAAGLEASLAERLSIQEAERAEFSRFRVEADAAMASTREEMERLSTAADRLADESEAYRLHTIDEWLTSAPGEAVLEGELHRGRLEFRDACHYYHCGGSVDADLRLLDRHFPSSFPYAASSDQLPDLPPVVPPSIEETPPEETPEDPVAPSGGAEVAAAPAPPGAGVDQGYPSAS